MRVGRFYASWWALGVWGAAAVYAVVLSAESLADHRAFETSFDAAVIDQRLWLLSRFEDPFSSVESRPFLAGHFEPGVVLLTPIYWLGLDLPGLLVAQSVALALTGPALYALARAAGAAPGLASIPAFLWLLSPAVGAANLFDVRAATFVPVLVVLSVLAALSARPVLLAVTAVLALSLKEDVALVYVVLGAILAFRGQRRTGIALAAGAAAWFVVAFATIASLADSDEFFSERFAGDRGDTLFDAAWYMLRNPLETIRDVVSESGLDLLTLVISTGGLALLAPVWLLLGLPTALHNALSAYEQQHTLGFHYHLPVVTACFVAAAIGVSRLPSLGRIPRAVFVAWGVVALAIGVVGGLENLEDEGRLNAAERQELERALERIPDDAPVAAAPLLLPHLSHRREIYSLPEPFVRIDWGGSLSEEELAEHAERVRFVALTGDTTVAEFEGDLGELYDELLEDGFVVVEESPVRSLRILERRP